MNPKSTCLPENIRRRMTAETRKELDQPTQHEADTAGARKSERLLHHTFEAWLRLNEIPYIHSRMDRKSTIREGWPDFTVFRHGVVCFIEFKIAGNGLSEHQEGVIKELQRATFLPLVTGSVSDAIAWIKGMIGML